MSIIGEPSKRAKIEFPLTFDDSQAGAELGGGEGGLEPRLEEKKNSKFFFQPRMFSKNDLKIFFEPRVSFKNICINWYFSFNQMLLKIWVPNIFWAPGDLISWFRHCSQE